MRRWWSSVGVVVLVVTAGCDGCGDGDDGSQGESSGDEERHPQRAAPETGIIEGVVRLADGAEVPAYSAKAVGRSPDRPKRTGSCPPPKEAERRPLQLGEQRGLSNVLVAVTGFSTKPAHDAQKHRVVIQNCTLKPQVVAATQGDTLVVENRSDYPFLPTLGSTSFMQALMKGQTREIELSGGATVRALTCSFAAPCGRTDVIVQAHPVHTLSEQDGRFRIENTPAGEELTVHAWHPLLQDAGEDLTAKTDETVRVELTLRPAERRAAPLPGGARKPDGGSRGRDAAAGEQPDLPTE